MIFVCVYIYLLDLLLPLLPLPLLFPSTDDVLFELLLLPRAVKLFRFCKFGEVVVVSIHFEELSLLTLPLTTRLRSFAVFDLEADKDEDGADIPKADLAFGELFLDNLPIFRTFVHLDIIMDS